MDNELTRESLIDLGGFFITIKLDTESGCDLDEHIIRTDVELQLRREGVAVVEDIDWADGASSDVALLSIYVFALLDSAEKRCIYSIQTSVYQFVILPRNPSKPTFAVTWSVEFTGCVGRNRIEEIRETIKDQLNKLVNAYLSVNPK